MRRDESLDAAKGLIALTATDKDGKKLGDVSVKSPEIPSLLGFTDAEGKLLITDAVAGKVTLQLRKLGYAKAQSIVGGIDAWSQEIDPEVRRY